MPTTDAPPPVLAWPSDDPRYDGEWFPRTLDAAAELALLVPELEARTRGPITRATLCMGEWSADQPRRVLLAGGLLRVGWFPVLGPGTATFASGTGPRIVLDVHRGARPGA